MFRKSILAAVAALPLSAYSASAQDSGFAFDGAFIDLGFHNTLDPFGDQADRFFTGAGAYMLTPRVGVQLGFQHIRDHSNEGVFQSIGLFEADGLQAHLFYDPTDDTRVGVFYSYEIFDSRDEISILGVEGVWTPERGRLEGRLGFFEDPMGIGATQGEILASADLFGGLDLVGEFIFFDYDDGSLFQNFMAGLAYDVTPRNRVYAMFGSSRSDLPGSPTSSVDLFQFGYMLTFGGSSEDSRVFRYSAN